MFEEVPRESRGLLGLPARRFVLGPFVIGGGLLLGTLGGSAAALAATVITASTIGFNDLPPHRNHGASLGSSSAPRIERITAPSSIKPATAGPSSVRADPEAPKPRPSELPRPTGASRPSTAPSLRPGQASPFTAVGPTSASAGRPAGNAIVYLSGYDRGAKRLAFSYAVVQPVAAPDGRDVYVVNDPTRYTAGIGSGVQITSGGGVCGPAGSACTVEELIAATRAGFLAEVAIDSDGKLEAVTEKGSPAKSADAQSGPSSSSPGGQATPIQSDPASTPSAAG